MDVRIDLDQARGWGTRTYGPGQDVVVPPAMAEHLVDAGLATYSADRREREAEMQTGGPDIQPLPVVAELPDVLAEMDDVTAIRAMWARDERVTAAVHYEDRLVELGALVRED